MGRTPVKLTKNLKEIRTKNASSAIAHGKFITDAICSWVKKGYVVGPFNNPPFKNFRVNPLMAAVQKTKVRPITTSLHPKEIL